MPRFFTRQQIAARVAAGEPLSGFAARSVRPSWERRAVTEGDVARVREALGEDAAAGRIVPFIASTPDRADDGMILPPSGCDLTRFQKNPRVFWQHMTWSSRPRIGDAVTWADQDAVRSLVSFIGRDLSEALDDGFSWAIGELAALRGHAMSIGFDVLAALPAPEEVRKVMPWAIDVVSWVLLEESLVHIPADANAVDEARAAGLDLEPLAAGFGRMLDELEGAGIAREQLERAWAAAVAGRSRTHSLPSAPSPASTTTAPPPPSEKDEIVEALRSVWGPLAQLPQP